MCVSWVLVRALCGFTPSLELCLYCLVVSSVGSSVCFFFLLLSHCRPSFGQVFVCNFRKKNENFEFIFLYLSAKGGWMHGLAVIHQRRHCLFMRMVRQWDAFVTYQFSFAVTAWGYDDNHNADLFRVFMHVCRNPDLFRRGLLVYLLGICYFGFGRMRFGSNGFVVLLDFVVDSMKLNVNFRYDENIYLMVFLNAKVRACQTKGVSRQTITSIIFWLSVCTIFARNFTALSFPSAEKNPM